MTHNSAPVAEPMAAEVPEPGSSLRAILAAAAELFAERTYDQVTIRDIAARAGLSPAMVMKCGGSKRELFLQAARITAPPLPDVPLSELGTALVGQLLTRSHRGVLEPLARALVLHPSAPDPDSVRQQFITGYLDPLTERLGGDADARLQSELVVAALTGLAANVRIFATPATSAAPDDVIRRYGAAIQHLIDT